MSGRKDSRWVTRHTQDGVSLVEFALVTPLLVLFLMGIFDLGRSIYYYDAISNGAREAARQSITACGNGANLTNCTSADNTTKSTVVNQLVGVPITTSNITISPSTRQYGNTITVTISIQFIPITPLIARYLGTSGQLTLSARSQMVVQ